MSARFLSLFFLLEKISLGSVDYLKLQFLVHL